MDAGRLERNLNLTLQILEITGQAVLCLNLIDEAKRHNITIDERALSKELGIPVVPTVARYSKGIPELLNTIDQVASGKIKVKPHRINHLPGKLSSAVDILSAKLRKRFPGLQNSRWIALRLLENDQRVIEALEEGKLY